MISACGNAGEWPRALHFFDEALGNWDCAKHWEVVEPVRIHRIRYNVSFSRFDNVRSILLLWSTTASVIYDVSECACFFLTPCGLCRACVYLWNEPDSPKSTVWAGWQVAIGSQPHYVQRGHQRLRRLEHPYVFA
jgi:hypothetical protein